MTTNPTPPHESIRQTGFHSRTALLTDDFVNYNGFWLANSYPSEDPLSGYWACRKHVSVMDLSALRKFDVLGPDAETLLQYTLTRNVRRLSVGQVTYSSMCFESGGLIDDGTLMRLGNDNFRWIGGTDFGGQWLQKQATEHGLNACVRAATDKLHNLSIQGPKSRNVLAEIVWTPPLHPSIDELAWYRLTVARIGDFDGIPIVVSRTGYTGELGYEVWCHPKHAEEVWDQIFAVGARHAMAPLGLEALDTLRIEAGFVFAGYEFDDDTNAFEAGIGFTVNLANKADDFIGKKTLSKFKDKPRKCLAGLMLDQDTTALSKSQIDIDHQPVGHITSAAYSPLLGKSIAMCHIHPDHKKVGTRVSISAQPGERSQLTGAIVELPFYDPEKTRVRN